MNAKVALSNHLVLCITHSLATTCTDEPVDELLDICKENKVYVSAPHTVPRILDKLISHFIEPECVQPTFLWGHPIVMSPLAKDIKLESVSPTGLSMKPPVVWLNKAASSSVRLVRILLGPSRCRTV